MHNHYEIDKNPDSKLISIVTPCYNEEENVLSCYTAVKDLFEKNLKKFEYEHIFCDNASTDNTVTLLEKLAISDKRVKVIVNTANFGVFRSMFNGVINTKGDAVVPFLPADLQDPPEKILEFIKHWENGFKVVFGQRIQREEPLYKRFLRKAYYHFVNRFSKTEMPLNAGEFMLIDSKAVEALKQFDDHQPYLRGMIFSLGFKSIAVPYVWKRRLRGKSKAGLPQMFDQGINGIVSCTNVPIRFGMLAGLITSAASIGYGTYNILYYFLSGGEIASKGTMTIIVALFFLSGLQMFFTALIGEYVGSIHSQIRKGPLIVEERRINF